MNSTPAKLLILDADEVFTSLLFKHLSAEGFEIHIEANSTLGIKKAINQVFDLIILDLNQPSENGFLVIKQLRSHVTTPTLVITARTDSLDELISFDLGVDDYVHKPCSPHEILARIKALLKRAPKSPLPRTIFEEHNIRIDCSTRLVTIAGNALELTNAEFNILETLIKSPNQAFSKKELTEFALGRKYTAYDRSIDVHISNLRNKLGLNPQGETWIKTVRGFGYLFDKPVL